MIIPTAVTTTTAIAITDTTINATNTQILTLSKNLYRQRYSSNYAVHVLC